MRPTGGHLGGGGSSDEDDLSPAQAEFDKFFRQHFASVVRYLATMFGTAFFVDDAVQEAMLVLWVKWSMLNDEDHRRRYLFVTAKHKFLRMMAGERLQSIRGTRVPLDSTTQDFADSSDVAMDWIEQSIDIIGFFRCLEPRQREAATLAWVCGFTHVEVARYMGISPGTVKAHLSRAREMLK